MAAYIDVPVQNHEVRIATRDHGGTGPPCLFLHGAGRSLADWAPLVSEIQGACRIVTMDLRGHGLSDDGTWTLEAVMSDIGAVLAHYNLPSVTLLGHALGGVLALICASAMEGTTHAVSLDGFALQSRHHVGLASADAERDWGRFWAETDRIPRFSRAEVEAEIDALHSGYGVSKEVAAEAVRRIVRADGDGFYTGRCGAGTIRGIAWLYRGHLLKEADLFASIRSSPARQLLIKSSAGDRADGRPAWQQRLHAAYHTGLDRQLQALAGSDRITVESIEADHFMVIGQAPFLAERIRRFLDV